MLDITLVSSLERILHEAMILTRENLKLTVISEGYQTEEEVFR